LKPNASTFLNYFKILLFKIKNKPKMPVSVFDS